MRPLPPAHPPRNVGGTMPENTPPEPAGAEVVSVRLGKKADAAAVQGPLDRWVDCA
jgi:hypothetical protein